MSKTMLVDASGETNETMNNSDVSSMVGIQFELKTIDISKIGVFIGVLSAKFAVFNVYISFLTKNFFPSYEIIFNTFTYSIEESIPITAILLMNSFLISFVICCILVLLKNKINSLLMKIQKIYRNNMTLFFILMMLFSILYIILIFFGNYVLKIISISLVFCAFIIFYKKILFGAKFLLIMSIACFALVEVFKPEIIKELVPIYIHTQTEKLNKILVCEARRNGDILSVRTENGILNINFGTILYFEEIKDISDEEIIGLCN